ncbi:hypothetical protein J7E88_11090 [Streptomyces sp. ISL-10]|uniref:hypothetical protein n=1 Tax=Streptomyces sp. ISL-10 TaxID=2819172 RepID=UPI001BE61B70|nr:hypothetical protein [Streptomyces sp. ISL-10]MBT2365837.1 hypothetical protein [Streptomyces sp. ISL-10]
MRTRVLTITAALLLAGACASSPEEKLESWYHSGGETHIMRLTDDTSRVYVSMAPIGTIGTACQDLLKDLAAAEAYDPIPDEDAQSSWSTALTTLRNGASECTAGAAAQDAGQVSQGVMEIQIDGLGYLTSTVHLIAMELTSE